MASQTPAGNSSADQMLRSAITYWNQGDYVRYLAAVTKVSELDPSNSNAFIDMGAAHGMLYEYAAASEKFEQAVALSANRAETLSLVALKCRNFNRYEMAETYFSRAVKEGGADPDMFAKLAEMHERLRKTAAAEEMVQAALHLDDSNALALLVRARLYRTEGRLEDAERTVRSFLSRSDSHSWSTRIRGWYELGAILDRQGMYDNAMAAFLQAKSMIEPNARGYRDAQLWIHKQYEAAKSPATAIMLRRWRSEYRKNALASRRFAVICGHPRSGTTLLEQLLDSHPKIVSAEETPIFFENYVKARSQGDRGLPMMQAMDQMPASAIQRMRDAYFADMQKFIIEPIGDRMLIDKNPSLTGLAHGLLRVIPETRFIVALRDPRDVCLSCFMQPIPLNQVSSCYLNLADSVAEYTALMGFWHWIASQVEATDAYLHVRYEDVVSNVQPVVKKTLAFLGLEWDERILRFDQYAAEKLVRSPTYAEVSKPITSAAVGRWKNYRKYLDPYIHALQPFLQAFGYADL